MVHVIFLIFSFFFPSSIHIFLLGLEYVKEYESFTYWLYSYTNPTFDRFRVSFVVPAKMFYINDIVVNNE
jgi:hypothetical protein